METATEYGALEEAARKAADKVAKAAVNPRVGSDCPRCGGTGETGGREVYGVCYRCRGSGTKDKALREAWLRKGAENSLAYYRTLAEGLGPVLAAARASTSRYARQDVRRLERQLDSIAETIKGLQP